MPYKNTDEYIASCNIEMQSSLEELRKFIKSVAPNAEERISYAMPAFFENGVLVYFGLQKKHIGFYPTASGIQNFVGDFKILDLKYSKGAVQFSIGQELPWGLIEKIIRFRVEENNAKANR